MQDDEWFADLWTANETRSYRIRRKLLEIRSKYQSIAIFDLYDKGVSLILGGHSRVFEIDEFVFHEGFVHFCGSRLQNLQSVLVIGDGDGGLIRELLKYDSISRIDWVEIDVAVINSCEQFLPSFPKRARADKRLSLHICDGAQFLQDSSRKFDAIFVSTTVGGEDQFAKSIWQPEILDRIKSLLTRSGVAAFSLAEFSSVNIDMYAERLRQLRDKFSAVLPYSIPLQSFGSQWGFALCGRQIEERKDNGLGDLRYYNDVEDFRMQNLPLSLKVDSKV